MTHAIEPFEEKQPEPSRPISPAPVHPLAALTIIMLDNIFGWIEIIDPFALALTCVSVGVLGFLTTMFVQRFLDRDEWGASVAKGLVMGVLAGVPFQVTGTAVGALLLGWAGASKWIKLPGKKQAESLPDTEIVEVDPKE